MNTSIKKTDYEEPQVEMFDLITSGSVLTESNIEGIGTITDD